MVRTLGKDAFGNEHPKRVPRLGSWYYPMICKPGDGKKATPDNWVPKRMWPIRSNIWCIRCERTHDPALCRRGGITNNNKPSLPRNCGLCGGAHCLDYCYFLDEKIEIRPGIFLDADVYVLWYCRQGLLPFNTHIDLSHRSIEEFPQISFVADVLSPDEGFVRAKDLHDRSAKDPMWPKRFDYGKEMNFLGSATPIMGPGSLRTPKKLSGRGPPATLHGPVAIDADWRRITVLAPPEPHPEEASSDYPIVLNDDGIVVSTWCPRYGTNTLPKAKWPAWPRRTGTRAAIASVATCATVRPPAPPLRNEPLPDTSAPASSLGNEHLFDPFKLMEGRIRARASPPAPAPSLGNEALPDIIKEDNIRASVPASSSAPAPSLGNEPLSDPFKLMEGRICARASPPAPPSPPTPAPSLGNEDLSGPFKFMEASIRAESAPAPASSSAPPSPPAPASSLGNEDLSDPFKFMEASIRAEFAPGLPSSPTPSSSPAPSPSPALPSSPAPASYSALVRSVEDRIRARGVASSANAVTFVSSRGLPSVVVYGHCDYVAIPP